MICASFSFNNKTILDLGGQPDRVFHVGSLLAEQIKNRPFHPDSHFFNAVGLNQGEDFIVVLIRPDSETDTETSQMIKELNNALIDPELARSRFLFLKPDENRQESHLYKMIDDVCRHHPNRMACLPETTLKGIAGAVQKGSLVISNCTQPRTMASAFHKPVIHLAGQVLGKDLLEDTLTPPFCPDKIVTDIQSGLSSEFNVLWQSSQTDFKADSTAQKIKAVLMAFELPAIRQGNHFVYN